MKKRIVGQPERRQMNDRMKKLDDYLPIIDKLSVISYDESAYDEIYWTTVYDFAEDEDDVIVVIAGNVRDDGTGGREYDHTVFSDSERGKEITDDEDKVLETFVMGLAIFFETLDRRLTPDAFMHVFRATEICFGFEDGFVLKNFVSLYKKGFKVRFVVPVPTEKYQRRRAEAEAEAQKAS